MHVVSVKENDDAIIVYGCFLQPGPKNIHWGGGGGGESQCLSHRASNTISRKGKPERLMELLICL